MAPTTALIKANGRATQVAKVRAEPRDYFDRLRAPDHPLTDDEREIALAEVASRHAANSKRSRDTFHRFKPWLRVMDLEFVFADRYGPTLPDDDAGWEDFYIIANHLAFDGWTTDRRVADIVEWAELRCPDFAPDKVTKLARRVVAHPRRWNAETLGQKLRLSMDDRKRLGVTTIGAFDVPKKDRPAWLAKHDRQDKAAKRRAKGIQTRAEWLAQTDTVNEWWKVMGMSERTWRRRGKPMPETSGTGPAGQTVRSAPPTGGQGVADHTIVSIWAAGPWPNPDAHRCGEETHGGEINPSSRPAAPPPVLIQMETVPDSAAGLDAPCCGADEVVDEVNPSSTPLSRPAMSLPCEDGKRIKPSWSSPPPQSLGWRVTGWQLPSVAPASVVLTLPPWMRAFAAAVRAGGMKGTVVPHGPGC